MGPARCSIGARSSAAFEPITCPSWIDLGTAAAFARHQTVNMYQLVILRACVAICDDRRCCAYLAVPALVFATALLVLSCGPSPAQIRIQQLTAARADAHQLPAARQAMRYSQAVHAAYRAGDYKTNPQALARDTADAIAVIDRAIPGAGVDAPTLVAWRALMFLDRGDATRALGELERSFQLGANSMAGKLLIEVYGGANRSDRVAEICAATVEILTSDDDKLGLIALCRENMNAASNEGEMAWMSPELVAWYQAENARRLGAEIAAWKALQERERFEQHVVRQTEQCAAWCKEDGLECQNACYGDRRCENRCVGINEACVDRCASKAYERLGM